MSLPLPNLDDRTFEQLVKEARRRIAETCPEWTDLSVHDPGVALVEAFAYISETVLYRVNQIPWKAYVAFLNLIDVQLQPPTAAVAELRFKAGQPVTRAIEIPRGTRVASSRPGSGGEPVVFTVDQTVRIEAGQTEVTAIAYHAEMVDAEPLGRGTGVAGLRVQVKRPPIVLGVAARTGAGDLMIGVEAQPGEITDRAPARRVGDTTFRIWSPVDTFVAQAEDPHVFVVDRAAGLIKFAPSAQMMTPVDGREEAAAPSLQPTRALAAVPAEGRQILAWYRRGGGVGGNVAAGTLDTIKDPIVGVSLTVTNPKPASGGRDAETIENALRRGPAELHSLRRAVTARDFEGLAMRAGGVARARAFTQKVLWEHAVPGTVDVVLVPEVGAAARGEFHERLSPETLAAHEGDPVLNDVSLLLETRSPLGTSRLVRWARAKAVGVTLDVAIHQTEDAEVVRGRILRRLYQALSPLPSPLGPGWSFGEPLLKSRIYDLVLSEPGIRYVRGVRFTVEPSPGAVRCLEADRFQPSTWYTGSEGRLFRSTNDGEGWELSKDFGADQVQVIAVNGHVPGLLACAVRVGQSQTFRIHLSRDCGQVWLAKTHSLEDVTGLAWTARDRAPLLLVATRKGLFEVGLRAEPGPLQVLVSSAKPNLGFTTLVAGIDARGAGIVAAAADSATEGVFLSTAWGKAGSFVDIGLMDTIRVLEIQRTGPTTHLWAGLGAPGNEDGRGCHRWEVREGGSAATQSWEPFTTGWQGGSVNGLTFVGSTVYAATHRRGVVSIDASRDKPTWAKPEIRVGLPLRQVQDQVFKPVLTVAAGPETTGPGAASATLMAATEEGVFQKRGDGYVRVPAADADAVTVPRDGLISSGGHQVNIVNDES